MLMLFRQRVAEANVPMVSIPEVICETAAAIIIRTAWRQCFAPCGVHTALGIASTATHGVPASDRLLRRAAAWASGPHIGGSQR